MILHPMISTKSPVQGGSKQQRYLRFSMLGLSRNHSFFQPTERNNLYTPFCCWNKALDLDAGGDDLLLMMGEASGGQQLLSTYILGASPTEEAKADVTDGHVGKEHRRRRAFVSFENGRKMAAGIIDHLARIRGILC
eukprot:scaffold7297_cov139-Skeletonema_dohrnii-CCMP3373.AAC.1